LARKRKDFADTANQAFSKGVAGLDYTLYHQVINFLYNKSPLFFIILNNYNFY